MWLEILNSLFFFPNFTGIFGSDNFICRLNIINWGLFFVCTSCLWFQLFFKLPCEKSSAALSQSNSSSSSRIQQQFWDRPTQRQGTVWQAAMPLNVVHLSSLQFFFTIIYLCVCKRVPVLVVIGLLWVVGRLLLPCGNTFFISLVIVSTRVDSPLLNFSQWRFEGGNCAALRWCCRPCNVGHVTEALIWLLLWLCCNIAVSSSSLKWYSASLAKSSQKLWREDKFCLIYSRVQVQRHPKDKTLV